MTVLHNQLMSECPESSLERKLIAEYLLGKGYRMSDVRKLPEPEMIRLMKEACRYAALRLAEIESRSKFRHKIETH